MKKYFCDVCGAELPDGQRSPPPDRPAAALCGLEDLCRRCAGLADGLDVSALALAELRRQAKQKQKAPAPDDTPRLTGRGAQEKREVLEAIEAFRQARGPGAMAELSRLSKVDEGTLRDMVLREKVPLAAWRKVGKALKVPGADRNGGNHETD